MLEENKEVSKKSLVRPSQALNTKSAITVTRHIRNLIGMLIDVDGFWDSLEGYFQAPGEGGSTQFDHAIIGHIILQHSKSLQGIKGLTPYSVYYHTVEVLKQRGYIFYHGYVVGHVSAQEEVSSVTKDSKADPKDPDSNES